MAAAAPPGLTVAPPQRLEELVAGDGDNRHRPARRPGRIGGRAAAACARLGPPGHRSSALCPTLRRLSTTPRCAVGGRSGRQPGVSVCGWCGGGGWAATGGEPQGRGGERDSSTPGSTPTNLPRFYQVIRYTLYTTHHQEYFSLSLSGPAS